MTRRSLIVLIVALVVLGGLAYFGQRSDTPATITTGRLLLPDLRSALNDVTSVKLTKAGGETVATIEKRDDRWVVAEKGGYPADVGKLRQNLNALADSKILEAKTSNPELYDKLGVQDVKDASATGIEVSITAPGKEIPAVILGDAKGSKQRYARRANERESYLLDHDPNFPKTGAEWLDAVIVDVKPERVQQVVIKHPDGETVTVSKADSSAMNFDVANVPKGRELLYAGVANVIGGSLRELRLEDVERAEGELERPVHVEFKTFDGLVVRVTGAKRGEDDWITLEASADPEQAARFAAAKSQSTTPAQGSDASGAAGSAGAESSTSSGSAENGSSTDAAPAAGATTSSAPTQPSADPAAEAEQINARVGGWRYKIAGYQFDQMTRRMADLLKPAG